jgi:hypothetical protein
MNSSKPANRSGQSRKDLYFWKWVGHYRSLREKVYEIFEQQLDRYQKAMKQREVEGTKLLKKRRSWYGEKVMFFRRNSLYLPSLRIKA